LVVTGHADVKIAFESGEILLVIKTTCFPFGLELAPCEWKVAGLSSGQFPHAALHG
jgi:hypothetical protein